MNNNKKKLLLDQNRRSFLGNSFKLAGAAALISFPGCLLADKPSSQNKTYTVQEVMDIVYDSYSTVAEKVEAPTLIYKEIH